MSMVSPFFKNTQYISSSAGPAELYVQKRPGKFSPLTFKVWNNAAFCSQASWLTAHTFSQ